MTTSSEDFALLLEQSFQQPQPERGDIVKGTVLALSQQGILVDVGLKSDGIVQWGDLERMNEPGEYQVGDRVPVMILKDDGEGNLILSISQARQLVDWEEAERLMESQEVWQGKIVDANRGGVIMGFGNLRGFVPASHVVGLPRDLSEEDRKYQMKQMIGQTLACKVIEVNRKRRRLVMSEREAQREQREARKEDLLGRLKEGDVVSGTISGMRDFGAFVDLGGADGLIHISELAWHRIEHPSEIVSPRQKLNVYVLRLDHENKRIELSLKRLMPNPWESIEERFHIGKLVEGTVSRVENFGAFVSLEKGVEGLLPVSQLHEPVPSSAADVLDRGQKVLVRVISLEPDNQRIGLSLRDVSEGDWAEWQAAQVDPSAEAENSLESPEPLMTGVQNN